MSISAKVYQEYLGQLFNEEMSEEEKYEIISSIDHIIELRVQSALGLLMDNLYEHDYFALKKDIIRIVIGGTQREAKPEERMELLRVLWWCIEVFFKGDISLIADECDRMIESYRQTGEYWHPDLPFV